MLITWKRTKNNDLGHLYFGISCTVFSARNFYRISHILEWIILSLARTTKTTTPSNKNGSDCVSIQSSIDKLWQKKPNITECLLRMFVLFVYRKVHFIQFGGVFFVGFVVKYFIKCFSAFRVFSSKNSFTFFLAICFNFIFAFLQSFLCFSVRFEKSA